MTDNNIIGAELTMSLDQLRYLVFQGMRGEPGQSAYALAVSLGFEGTEAEWIASLKGAPGQQGAPGIDGTDGVDGVSPTVTFSPITVDGRTGNKMTVTDAAHPSGQSIDILNGKDGESGTGGGAVSSVNGKTGVVVLDAADVGALPANTPIPAEVTEQTVSGWGFTKNTGTYSKPSGGIPASDLAQAVQDALDATSSGLTEDAKQALLDCFEHVAWINDDGQTYYDALYAALYNEPAPPSPVPNEYQRVEWVGTQNSSIAYILTGISESGMAALAGYSIHLTAAFGVSQPIDGEDTNGSVIAFSSKAGTYFGSLKTGRVAIGTSETYALPNSVVCTNKNDYIAEYSNTGLTISSNNQSVSRNYSTSGDTAQELTIGTGSVSSLNVAAWSQFYSVKVYKNETLVADFFPVYRIADGVIGFYDAVRNQFYTNSGSGSFVKGGDIA